jgi:hypothetical protein
MMLSKSGRFSGSADQQSSTRRRMALSVSDRLTRGGKPGRAPNLRGSTHGRDRQRMRRRLSLRSTKQHNNNTTQRGPRGAACRALVGPCLRPGLAVARQGGPQPRDGRTAKGPGKLTWRRCARRPPGCGQQRAARPPRFGTGSWRSCTRPPGVRGATRMLAAFVLCLFCACECIFFQ